MTKTALEGGTDLRPGRSMSSDPAPELAIRELVRAVWHQRWRIAVLTAVVVLGTVISVLTTKRTYTSNASFLQESGRSSGGGLAGLAQQYGLAVSTFGSGGQSLQFYVELIRSREILSQLITDTISFSDAGAPRTGVLLDLLEVKGGTQPERVANGVDKLRAIIRPAASQTTGIVRFDVTTRSATLSHAIAQRMFELIDEFNLGKRQSQGATERRFAERRLTEATDSLRAAEKKLLEFEQSNATWSAPHLRIIHTRLASDLAMRQTLQSGAAQAVEQARIEEIRDTPLITPVERPITPARPDSRGGVQKLMFAFIASLGLGIGVAIAHSQLPSWRAMVNN
jgi:uncharacterized protein involved in exopolysaccharide biosynthesis